ncbi:QueT transporter family protein [bacterium]|nr:QueT transporter family protein [bacterium]
MKDTITMWKYTRMIVLTALTAGLYAALLIPFKIVIPLIPGFTEFRPANVIPIVASIFFGPAAAWGAAIGNFIADVLGGTLGFGSIPGFIGNFFLGYIPYKLWWNLRKMPEQKVPHLKKSKQIIDYLYVLVIACATCGLLIGWGVDSLGLVPFAALGNIIFLNNLIVGIILGPFLLLLITPRIRKWGMFYFDIMKVDDLSRIKLRPVGIFLIIVGSISGMVLGNLISIGVYDAGMLGFGFSQGISGGSSLFLGALPSVLILILGCFLV